MPARLTLSPLWGCAVYVAFSAASPVFAQELSLGPQNSARPPAPDQPHSGYAGVKPGGDQAPPAITAKPGSSPTTITWPGFQTQPDGSSRVFLQSTAQLSTHAAMTSGNMLTVDLGEVRIAGRTNRYPLVTNFFNTPVTKVELKRAGKRTVLELTLRAQVQPSISSERASSGYYFVYIDFPPGQYVVARALAAAAPPPKIDTLDAPNDPPAPSADASANGSVNANASLSTSMDSEAPPGVVAPKARAKAKAKAGFGIGN